MELSFLSMANNDNTNRESEILYLLLFIFTFYSSLNLSKMLTIFSLIENAPIYIPVTSPATPYARLVFHMLNKKFAVIF